VKEGRTSVNSERSGQPSTSENEENVQKVGTVNCSIHHLTVPEVAEEVETSKNHL
jgi:hypothetical protein